MSLFPSDAARRAPSVADTLAAVLCTALLGCASASPDPPSSQEDGDRSSNRVRVLVPPLQISSGLKRGFSHDVAERVRQRLRDFDVLTSVTGDEIEDALDQFDLSRKEMTPVQWRQLAGQIDAGLILFGEAEPASGGEVRVRVRFVDASTGDELSTPGFTVSDDDGGGRQEAATRIAEELDRQVTFLRSLLFCEDYYGVEQYEDALRNCNKALSISEASTRAHMIRGQIYRQQEEWEEARQDFAAVLEHSESNTEALQNLAYVNAQLGNAERATELYREYLTFNPDDAQIRLNVAYNLASAGALDEAITLLQEGVERDSTNANLWKYLGDVALRKGTTGSGRQVQGQGASVEDTAAVRLAVDAYGHVLDIRGDSASAELIRNTIGAQMQMGNLQEALEFAESALEDRPEDVDLLSLKASVLSRQGEYGEAAAVLDSVVSLDPDYDQVYVRLGKSRLQAGASADAVVSDFEKAVEQGTDGNAIADQLLTIGYNDYFESGDLATASELFETGLEFAEPGSQSAHQLHFFLGYGAYQRGRDIDRQNDEEACQPARRALQFFERAAAHLKQAGNYQAGSQKKLGKATGEFIYRQNQIIKKAC